MGWGNEKADDRETWYAALVTRVLSNLFRLWPCVDLDLFYRTVKFRPFCFCMGKYLGCRCPRNYWSLWGESWYIQSDKWVQDDLWQPKVKIIQWPLSKVTQVQHYWTSFPQNPLGHLKPNFIWSLHRMLGWNFIQMFRVILPRWLPGPYIVKTLKLLLLRNQEADDLKLGIQHRVTSSTKVVQMMSLGWPWPFYDMVKFVSKCFCMGENLYSI